MSDNAGFGGLSLLDLFKLEAEAHCAALSEGLLAMEKAPDDRSIVEPLMRAAHSIKGAARIIGLDAIVSLAHAMEDCFLAAKAGHEALSPARVDQLLKAVDIVSELRSLAEPDLPAWTRSQSDRLSELTARLRAPPPSVAPQPEPAVRAAMPAATPPPSEAPPSAAPTSAPPPAPSATIATAAGGQTVRVAASALTRMLFLAGESTVEAARLQSLRSLLTGLKLRERALETAVQELREHHGRHGLPTPMAPAVGAARHAGPGEGGVDSVARAVSGMQTALADQSVRFDEAFRRLEELSGALYSEILRSRMRPFAEGITAFPRMVRDIARQLGKPVDLRIQGESVEVDRDTLQKLESPLTHLIRNSLDHGVETPAERIAAGKPPTATIVLAARHQSGSLVIEVRDDGRGIDLEGVRRKVVERRMVDAATAENLTPAELMEFLFLPGFSTKQGVTELSGRGVGLDIVQSAVREVGGTVRLDSELGRGARFTIRLPITRSVIRGALVRIAGELYAVPLARLDRIALVSEADIRPVQGRLQFTLEDESVGLVHASEILGGERAPSGNDVLPVLVVGAGGDRCGLGIDQVCGEEDLVVRPLDPRLGAVPHIAASAIRSDGTPVFVLDVDDILRSLKQSLHEGRVLGVASAQGATTRKSRRRILIVDDSITVREVERQLLTRRGYDVEVAVDGREGYSALRAGRFDLMVTDVDMPRMTGIELIRAVRREPRFAELPIIIVSYKDREEDRLLGLEAGASAYLTKSSFQDDSLIRMVEELIGAPG
ncbi:MAG: hybrid sensor histidine kinase/response regulator [Phycisphaerales bacterium]|nr:hybrid sensor histidine kinase/response regulator [Phycisphaerales bacterium]